MENLNADDAEVIKGKIHGQEIENDISSTNK